MSEAFLAQSDIVSLHSPFLPATECLINERNIHLMKSGVMLINTARGAVVDARAVIEALTQKDRVAYFGIDVYEEEGPLFFSDRSSTAFEDHVFERLTTFANVVITAHQAFLTREVLRNRAHRIR